MSGRIWLGLVVVLVVGFYGWTSGAGNLRIGEQQDYYNLLSRGFQSGHLFMPVAPVAVKDSRADELGLGNLPFLLDASFYRGKYYLYFGPTPVLTAFLPFRLLVGHAVSEAWVAVIYASAGYLVSLRLIALIRRRFFPETRESLLVVFAVLLGLGNVCAATLRHPMFYEVAITSAYFFFSLFLLGLFRAFIGVERRRSSTWLAVASLAYGLSVGARVTYALGAFSLVVAAVWLWRKSKTEQSSRENSPKIQWVLLAALGPVVACAFGLMGYNYQRFGSVFSFGTAFQTGYKAFFGPQYILHNLRLYYFSLPELSWYFPFTTPVRETFQPPGYVGTEQIHGQAWATVFVLPLLGLMTWGRRRVTVPKPLLVFGGCVLVVYFNNLLVILCLGGRTNRYQVDFQPAFLLLAAISILAWFRPGILAPAGRRVARVALIASTTLVGLHNVFVSFQLYEIFKHTHPAGYEQVARVMNQPSQWLAPLLPKQGPLTFTARFPSRPGGELEPLVVTGANDYADFVLVHYLDPGVVRFVFLQPGAKEIVSPPIQVGIDQPHLIRADLGSFYPPAPHPFFQPFSRGERNLTKRRIELRMDGAVVLAVLHDLHDASPGHVYVGENPFSPLLTKPRFSGRLTEIRREGTQAARLEAGRERSGAIALQFSLPTYDASRPPEPLVVTGDRERGEGVFVRYEAGGYVRFGCERWGGVITLSEPMQLAAGEYHALEVWMGSLFPAEAYPMLAAVSSLAAETLMNSVRVKLDGREVLRTGGPFFEADWRTVDLGGNAIGLLSCPGKFGGSLSQVRRQPPPAAAPDFTPLAMGPLRMQVTFPMARVGTHEPLLSTGRAGAGDLVFIAYEDRDTIRIGFDHGSDGRLMSEPIKLAGIRSHRIEIDEGALYPEEGLGRLTAYFSQRQRAMREAVRVRLDGQEVLNLRSPLFPASASQVFPGENAIGAASCEQRFTGRLDAVERLAADTSALAMRSPDYGPLQLDVVLPRDRVGQSEPLIVTGVTGAADALIITYVDAQHIKLAWDHWGLGGPSSALLPIESSELQRLEVTMGSFYPEDSAALKRDLSPAETAHRRRRLEVKLNGEPVLGSEGVFHPSRVGELAIGRNAVGLSTALPVFSGTIENVRRAVH